jgi:hypothetical protein
VVGCVAGKEVVDTDKCWSIDSPELTERKEQRNVYKVVLSHEIMPGKLNDFVAWCKQADAQRKEQDPAYEPFRRFITCFGSTSRVVIEMETEDPTAESLLWESFAAKGTGPPGAGSPGGFNTLIVPDGASYAC